MDILNRRCRICNADLSSYPLNRVFCNNMCSWRYYQRKLTGLAEHNQITKKINKLIKGKVQQVISSKPYNPDIIKKDIDYEIEMFNETNHLSNKATKWNKDRTHILIINIADYNFELFDEIYFYDKKENKLKRIGNA